MIRKFEIVATVGEYTDKDTGRKVKRTLPIGGIYESSNGRLVMRLDAVPTQRDWSGWAALHPVGKPLPPGRRLPPGMPPAPEIQPEDSNPDEDVPF